MAPVRAIHGRVYYVCALTLLVSARPLFAELPTEDPPHGPLHPMLAKVIKAGPYEPQWACAPGNEGGTYNLSIGETTIRGKVASNTGAWQTYQVSDFGTITVGSKRSRTAILRSETIPAGKAMMNVRRLVLAPVK